MVMDNTIIGVYFICCKHNYLDIVKEQVEILNKGLFQITKKLIIFITEYNKDTCTELDAILNTMLEPNKCIRVTSPDNLFEKFAINHYKQYITENEYYLYYFHTKAIKPETDQYFQICSSRRKILNYYILLHYNISIQETFGGANPVTYNIWEQSMTNIYLPKCTFSVMIHVNVYH